jgi:hypothetical protein
MVIVGDDGIGKAGQRRGHEFVIVRVLGHDPGVATGATTSALSRTFGTGR